MEKTPARVDELLEELAQAQHQAASLRSELAVRSYEEQLANTKIVAEVPVLAMKLPGVDAQVLREMCDRFRHRFPSSIAALGTVDAEGRPLVVASVTEDLVKRGLHAGELVKYLASYLGGGGGGRPTLAQAGGKDASRLDEALEKVPGWVAEKLG
jgi:alanyl-tRNA synthetase